MRALLALVAILWLSTGFMTCCAAHAAEPVAEVMPVASDGLLHSDGDHDQLPADGHGDYPHHHTGCGGHDVGNGPAKIAGPGWPHDARRFAGGYAVSVAEAPPGKDLRPPIS